jgi:intracellular sulfur oxidation DsrE/DsrF family protein
MEDAMHRRNILTGALAGAGGLIAAAVSAARANAQTKGTSSTSLDKSKVVYHLADLDKVSFVLGNIRNHFDGVGGPDKVTIALVVHGPALKAFHTSSASRDLAQQVGAFAKAGLELNACGNTMSAQNVTLNDLLPGFIKADQGGVVRIAELQSMGYVYLRP